jgi:hypothetical protein
VVVALFLELVAVAVAGWFELLETEGRTVAKAAMLVVPAGIAELVLELLEDPSAEVARN